MNEVTVAIIGAGQRGNDTYGNIMFEEIQGVKVVGVADLIEERRIRTAKKHQIDESYVFESYEQLLSQEKFCDAVLVCTTDELHYEPAKMALEKGYHLLLEKPMVNKQEDVEKLEKLIANHPNQIFMVCHVLRYSPFFVKIKELLEANEIGEVISVQHNENVGYYHIAHSFVRGIWRNCEESSPIILAKSCHDLDILNFLIGSKCTKIASFGQLKHFRKECAPEGSSDRCLTCKVESTCPYSAKKIYLNAIGGWPATVATSDQTVEGVTHALEVGPYGRCVYHCDNDVVDHQATILEYENGVSATFNLSGFTHDISRTLKIMGSHGELRAHMELNEIEIHYFNGQETKKVQPLDDMGGMSGHGGGDARLLADFINLVRESQSGKIGQGKTNAKKSLESHKMAFAAEESRLTNKVVLL